jgi:ribokinase
MAMIVAELSPAPSSVSAKSQGDPTIDAAKETIAVNLRESRYVSGRSHRRGRSPIREDGLLRRHHDHAVESLRAALKSLRTRSGLTVERLRATELTLAPFDLDVVRQLEQTQQLSPEEAIVAVVRGAAAQLDVDDMLIVDAALALGLVAESFPDAPDAPGISALYAPDLSDRRTALVESWSALRELVGAGRPTPPPTVRSLRTDLESRAFERLAERILTASPLDMAPEQVTASIAPEVTTRSRSTARASNGTAPRVVVVGAAVMDQIYAVDHVPEPGTAVQATSYHTYPGGKGLNLAVAAARLGMEVHLLAPLGDDDTGRQLLAYLEAEGVHTELVRMMPGATTPVAGVLVTPDGMNSTIGWMNVSQMSITARDVTSRLVTSTLENADAVMLTFSVAWDTIETVLETTASAPHRPTILLKPSPPYEGARFAHESLRYVDYLIGTEWELSRLLPGTSTPAPAERLLTQLLVQGAGTVCVAEAFGCTVRSSNLSIDIPPPPIAVEEAPGALDAFTAALALRLHESDGRLDEASVRWATAALAVPQTLGGVASSMPTRDEIDRVVTLASSGRGDTGDR